MNYALFFSWPFIALAFFVILIYIFRSHFPFIISIEIKRVLHENKEFNKGLEAASKLSSDKAIKECSQLMTEHFGKKMNEVFTPSATIDEELHADDNCYRERNSYLPVIPPGKDDTIDTII